MKNIFKSIKEMFKSTKTIINDNNSSNEKQNDSIELKLDKKEKRRIAIKKWQQANKDKMREYKRKYNKEHPEKIKMYNKRAADKRKREKLLNENEEIKRYANDNHNKFLSYQKHYYKIVKQTREKNKIDINYNVKRIIITNDNTIKGLFDKPGYEAAKVYLDQIFTKIQIQLLLEGHIDYLLVV